MKILWQSPGPSSAYHPKLVQYPKRILGIQFEFESEEGDLGACELKFLDVVAFKCTYLPALSAEMINSSYDKLVDMGRTDWLAEAQNLVNRKVHGAPKYHLRICFDDGPCYEFLCAEYEVVGVNSCKG